MGTPSSVGRRLKALRKKQNLTIRGLADKARVLRTTIDGLEAGRQKRTSFANASRLARALDADISVFVPELRRTG